MLFHYEFQSVEFTLADFENLLGFAAVKSVLDVINPLAIQINSALPDEPLGFSAGRQSEKSNCSFCLNST